MFIAKTGQRDRQNKRQDLPSYRRGFEREIGFLLWKVGQWDRISWPIKYFSKVPLYSTSTICFQDKKR